jgi:hypothetical protein
MKVLLVVYLFTFLLVCFSLSVPPAEMPLFVLMLCIAAIGIAVSFRESRRWRIIWIIALTISILGGTLDVIAGKRIARERLKNEATVSHANSVK